MRYQPLDLDALILAAQKPSRYVGGEVNAVQKELAAMRATWALCFPEVYELGMSNVGFRVLYDVLNRRADLACERVFMPWPDLVAGMRERGVPLFALESRAPVRDFDILGFSLQFEAGYTTVLAMLELAGVPLLASERSAADPLVVAGGPCAFNGEPMAPFFDAMALGDGEEVALDISDAVAEWKAAKGSRRELLERLARIPGVYVPSFFQVRYAEDRTIAAIEPLRAGYERVSRRVVADLERAPMPSRPIVPFMQAVHDRLPLEIQRGCVRGCRFCQVGMVSRPVRQRAPATILAAAEQGLAATGWEEVGFLSLSAGDYGCLNGLLETFFARFSPERIAISLPSLRTETMTEALAQQIAQVKKTGFTIAPEAASERLRRVINKGNAEENLLKAVRSVFGAGWGLVKLYFMIGLPTETDEDVQAIAELAKRALRAAREIRKDGQLNVSVSTFVPKPFTPFQWEPMIPLEETIRRHDLLRAAFPRRGAIAFKYHEAQGSLVEAALARGDRRMATAVLAAYRAGQVLDGWTEHFRFERWQQALQQMEKEHGVSAEFFANRERGEAEILPWDHLDAGVSKRFLLQERAASRAGETLEDCVASRCGGCEACDFKELKNRLYEPEPVALVAPSVPAPAAPPAEGAPQPTPPVKTIVRLRYAKRGRAIALSHLETMNAALRALRRSGLAVAYTQGFNPRPRVSFGPACPVGVESEAEYIDLELAAPLEAEAVRAALGPQLPALLPLLEVLLLEPGAAGLGVALSAVRYCAELEADSQRIDPCVERFHAAGVLESERVKQDARGRIQKRVVDLKKVVLSLRRAEGSSVVFELKAGNEASAKPSEVLAAVFEGMPARRIVKQAVIFASPPKPDQ